MSESDRRPPAYLSKATLARELDCSESHVDTLVNIGVLPKPIRLSSGCVRWEWAKSSLPSRH
jgi:predicted DNA-binding transcriptional regulator AlpA